jgi:hypothetical protein
MHSQVPSAMQGLACSEAAGSIGAAGVGDGGASDSTRQARGWGSKETAQNGLSVHPANGDEKAETK